MSRRVQRFIVAGVISLTTLLALPCPLAVAMDETTQATSLVLTLDDAVRLAETYNPGIQLARIQLQNARAALDTAPENAMSYASAVSLYAEAELGMTIPEDAITPEAGYRQAQITFEQAVAQYQETRQQVYMSAIKAYVEWQRATAVVAAQQSGLDRAITQEEHVRAMLDAGTVAQYDLLQVQAQVAGQEAALAGALSMREAARHALEAVIGYPLSPELLPEPIELRSSEIQIETDLDALITRALKNRPDVRRAMLDLAAARLQASLAVGGLQGAAAQLQSATSQYHLTVAQARSEVRQALLQLQTALKELEAREAALLPAQEALRLAELRYDAGLSTYLEVQSAFAAALQAESARIQAATNVLIGLYQLAQATGDL